MNSYERIYDLLLEVKGGPQRQRYRAGLSEIPQQQDFRRQARGFGAGPHDKPDPEEGSKKDVMSAQEKLAILRGKEKTATGIQLAQIRKFISHLRDKQSGKAKLGEGALSKEVREEPGDEMTYARGRIGAGQYAKAWKDKKGAKKQGRKAAKLIAKHRTAKKKKHEKAEARAQTVRFTAGSLRGRRGK